MSEIENARRELRMIYSRLKKIYALPSLPGGEFPRGLYEDLRNSMEGLEHVNSNLVGILDAVYIIGRKLDYIEAQTYKFPDLTTRRLMQERLHEIRDELKKIYPR